MPRTPKAKLNQNLKAKLATELANRVPTTEETKDLTVLDKLRNKLFDKQQNVLDDKSRLIAVLCSRRSGKSVMACVSLVIQALSKPRSKCLYLGLTRATAKRDALPIIQDLNLEFGLGFELNNAELIFTHENNSQIILSGIDVDYNTMHRLRGSSYDLIVIDEAQSIRFNLEDVVWSVLKPTTIDRQGSIILVGTPGYSESHYFFKAACSEEKNHKALWSRHHWTTLDNPHLRSNFKAEIENFLINDPLFLQTPKYKREYEGKWITDSTKLVYHFNENINLVEMLPENKYTYILSCDLGYTDATAFTVACYAETDSNYYIVESFKKTKMDIIDVAMKLKSYIEKYKPVKTIIDGSNAQFVESLRTRFALQLEATKKLGKEDWINLFDTELQRGRVKLLANHCDDLIKEMQDLIYEDLPNGKRQEHRSLPNHACDSALYNFRASSHYIKNLQDQINARNAITLDPYEYRALERWKRQQELETLLGEALRNE